MKFKDLITDSQSIEKFNKLSAQLATAAAYICGGIDTESIGDLDAESIREVEEAYTALVLAVGNMDRFLSSSNNVTSGNVERDRREETEAMMRADKEIQEIYAKTEAAKHKPLNQFKQTKEEIQAAIQAAIESGV